MIDYAFETAGLNQLVSMTPVSNGRSERVMQKLGMVKHQEHFLHPKVAENSALKEHVLYTLNREQWLAK